MDAMDNFLQRNISTHRVCSYVLHHVRQSVSIWHEAVHDGVRKESKAGWKTSSSYGCGASLS